MVPRLFEISRKEDLDWFFFAFHHNWELEDIAGKNFVKTLVIVYNSKSDYVTKSNYCQGQTYY